MKCIAVSLLTVFFAAGCSGSRDKCEKVIDKTMSIVVEMAAGMGEAMGEDNPDAVKDMEAKFEAKRPEMMAKCEELVKSNPDAEKALDCIIAAADFDAMQKCDTTSLDALMRQSK